MTPAPLSPWRQTSTGRTYWPIEPRASDVCAEDIAHHLSQMCRYAGTARQLYSVAEHSVGVMAVVAGEFVRRGLRPHKPTLLAALLHDGSEAYCQDLIRPLKVQPEFSAYREIEARNMAVINTHFGDYESKLTPEWSEIITFADDAMLTVERALFLLSTREDWRLPEVPPVLLADAMTFLECRPVLEWRQAKALFLDMLERVQDAD